MFVVCEGLDASGKTTTIKEALKYLGNDWIYSKALMTDTIAGRISRRCPSTLSLLTEVAYLDCTKIRPELADGGNIVQDRWFYSVLSHNPQNFRDEFLGKLFVPWITKPDLLVYFTVSYEERIRRLEERSDRHDKLLLENKGLIMQREERFRWHYDSFPGEKRIIDTTGITPEESGSALFKIVGDYELLSRV